MAMGDRHRLLIAVRDGRAGHGEARRIEMIAAPVNPFVGPDGEGKLTEQQRTALGMDLIERAAELQPVAHLGTHALPEP
jgi:hypothetical protein